MDKMKFWWFWRLRRWIRSDGYCTAGDERRIKKVKKECYLYTSEIYKCTTRTYIICISNCSICIWTEVY